MTSPNINIRSLALDAFMKITNEGDFLNEVVETLMDKYAYLPQKDRAFINRVLHGTLEYLIQIDFCIEKYSKIEIKKMRPVLRGLLRISVYQILFMDRVPDSAVCSEALKIIDKRRMTGFKPFTNAILRNISRDKETLVFDKEYIKLSIPKWMHELWHDEFGKEKANQIAGAFLKEKDIYFRINQSKIDIETCKARLIEQGYDIKENQYFDDLISIKNINSLKKIGLLQEGLIQIQDISATIPLRSINIQKGQTVLDICAAPGGKSYQAADIMQDEGQVIACDISASKIRDMEYDIRKKGFSSIKVVVQDATVYNSDFKDIADIVIADLPCSGLGVLGTKPDIKLHATIDRCYELQELQRHILSNACQYVKKGGILLYSTCTIDRHENMENVEWFLDEFKDYISEKLMLPEKLGYRYQMNHKKYIQIFPFDFDGDGFFIAAFRRGHD